MRRAAVLTPAAGALLALIGWIAGWPVIFWAGALVAAAAAIRAIYLGGSKEVAGPALGLMIGGTFVHPWYFGLAAGLCVWAAFRAIYAARSRTPETAPERRDN